MSDAFFETDSGLMEWKLEEVKQETHNRFLNYFVLRYLVNKNGSNKEHIYFTASRKSQENLRSLTHDYTHPDGVIIGIYRFNEGKLEILLTKQFREPIGSYVFSIPAGLVDNDEDLFETAKREASEEAGIASLKNMEILTPFSPTSSGLSDESNAFVMAEAEYQSSSALEEFEDISTKFVPIEKCLEMFKNPKYIIPLHARMWILYMSERFKAK